MSGFEINLYSASQEFHRYSTDDFALLEIGVGNFNTSSLAKFLNLTFIDGVFNSNGRLDNPDIKEFFNDISGTTLADKLIGFNSVDNMEILAFDEEDKVYKLKKGFTEIVLLNTNRYKTADFTKPSDQIKTFLDVWNKVQLGIETDNKIINGYKAVVNRIQNSLSGCILYDVDLNILGTERKSKMRLSFLNTRDNESSKTISFNGSPFISALPQDAVGLKHSRVNTDNAPPGVYAPASKPNGGPRDMVGAQMRLVYDPATKTWESGTQQVLARLVDNIDGVKIPELSGEEMVSISASRTYGVPPEENPWMGKPETGRAIPLSTEDGNPNLYGPNFRGGCGDTAKSVVIQAVNRSNKSFTSGTLVVLSYINDEWLIIVGDSGPVEKKITFGNFEYQQYVIPANHFFAVPKSAQRITPASFVSKYRDWFYLGRPDTEHTSKTEYQPYIERKIMDPSSAIEDWDETVNLNILVSRMPSNNPNPIDYLIKNRTSTDLVSIKNAAFLNKDSIVSDTVFGVDKFFNMFRETGSIKENADSVKPLSYHIPIAEQDFAVPKNMLARSAETLALDINPINLSDSVTTGANRWNVPLFWGALFPDGYKTAGTSKFLADVSYKLKVGEIYANDPKLAELSIAAAASFPHFKEQQDLVNFLSSKSFNGVLDKTAFLGSEGNPDKARKNGVFFTRGDRDYLKEKLKESKEPDGESTPSVWGLEPLQPKRIQFSPMSIDFLHTPSKDQSVVISDDFIQGVLSSYLLISSGILQNELTVGGKTFSFTEYGKYLWDHGEELEAIYPDNIFTSNFFYALKMLDYKEAFDSKTITRHPPPIGTPNGNDIFPELNGAQRSAIMPIITIKSTIKTSGAGLRFTTNQRFGYKEHIFLTGGGQGSISSIYGGLFGNYTSYNPGTPISQRNNPQWGDSSGRETYDSFGTMGLHVRVFESWPHKDTEYLGGIFTPLHYNDRVDNIEKKTWKQDDSGWETSLDPSGVPYLIMSDVDFKEPTLKTDSGGIGATMTPDTIVTEKNLVDFSDWNYNFIRRDKLLSGGGFAYVKRAIFVSDAGLDPSGLQAAGGFGYKNGDKFVYPDGFTLEVNNIADIELPDGKVLKDSITGFKIESNLDKGYIKNINTYRSDITSVANVTPLYVPSSVTMGAEAMLKVKSFKIGKLIGYDPPPKEVVPITRITKPSNRGVDRVEGSSSTIVDFDETNKKEFDIFYFFQNDPIVYALKGRFDNADAHFVISEVDPI